MRSFIFCAVLFGISQSMPTSDIWEQLVISNFDSIDHVSAFKNWQNKFEKKYNNSDDEAKHFLVFLDNWRSINDHNKLYKAGESTFTMGLNQFGDMTFDEFKIYVHGHSGSCINKKDDVYHISTVKESPHQKKTVKPTIDTVKPTIDTVKPTVDTVKPTIDTVKKTIDTIKPTIDTVKPTIDTVKPTIDTVKPTIDTLLGEIVDEIGMKFNGGKFSFKFGRRLADIPASIDWTNINGSTYVTPVKNQGQCGSCWAFSTTGSIESRSAIKNGWTGSEVISLSEQQLVDCSKAEGNAGCNGGLMEDAFKYVEKSGGLCTESEYPYTARDGTCKSSTCGKKYDSITGYKVVTKDSEPALQEAVAAGPVSVSVDAAGETWQFYKGGVVDGHCGIVLDHGVLAVGYGHDTSSNLDYWKIKNSWGKTWGEEGYIRLCRNCNKNDGAGECGVLRDDSYPTL